MILLLAGTPVVIILFGIYLQTSFCEKANETKLRGLIPNEVCAIGVCIQSNLRRMVELLSLTIGKQGRITTIHRQMSLNILQQFKPQQNLKCLPIWLGGLREGCLAKPTKSGNSVLQPQKVIKSDSWSELSWPRNGFMSVSAKFWKRSSLCDTVWMHWSLFL